MVEKFKNPSALIIKAVHDGKAPKFILDLKRGETFLRNGAVCMRVEVGSIGVRSKNSLLSDDGKPFIMNLQTGRVWAADDEEVELVRVEAEVFRA